MVVKYTPRIAPTPNFYARQYLWMICMSSRSKYNLYLTGRVGGYRYTKRLAGKRGTYLKVITPLRKLLFRIPSNVRICLNLKTSDIFLICIKERFRRMVHSLADLIRATVGGGVHAYRVIMEVRGLGYKVFITQRDRVDFKLGFSHMVYFRLKNKMYAKALGIKSRVFAVYGYDLIQVTAVAAHIRTLRRINVYKGKGIFKKYQRYKVKEGKRKKN